MAEKLLTRSELAKRLDVHAQTITKWTADGCPVARPGRAGVPHRYRESEVRAWRQAREEAAETGGVIDLTRARAEKEHWQAKLAEQKLKTLEGELLPLEDVQKAWAAEVTAVRARLLAWSTTLADRVHRAAVIDGIEGVELVISEAVRELLTELSKPERDEKPQRKRRAKRRRKAKKTTRRKAKKATKRKARKKKAVTPKRKAAPKKRRKTATKRKTKKKR